MLIIEIELLIALVLVLIAITRRTAITQWLANRRYQNGLKRARKLFQSLDQRDGQNAIVNHLLEEGHFLRSKRRVGDFYCIPDEDIDGEKQDIILRMSHKNEPRWIALRRLYLRCLAGTSRPHDAPPAKPRGCVEERGVDRATSLPTRRVGCGGEP